MLIVYFISIGYLVKLTINKKITHVSFVTSLTLMMILREKLVGVFEQVPTFTGYFGRIDNALQNLKHITKNFDEFVLNKNFKRHKLKYNEFKFENVDYNM